MDEAGFPNDNETLLALATVVAKMKYPSVEDLLRKYGYRYEAARVAELVAHVDQMNKERNP